MDQKSNAGTERSLGVLVLKPLEVEAGSDSHNRRSEVNRLVHGLVECVGQEVGDEVDFVDQATCDLRLDALVGCCSTLTRGSGVAHIRC